MPQEVSFAIPPPIAALFARVLDVREQQSTREKLWLSIEEASAYSGLAKSHLRALCVAGTLKSVRSRGWRIRRVALEGVRGMTYTQQGERVTLEMSRHEFRKLSVMLGAALSTALQDQVLFFN